MAVLLIFVVCAISLYLLLKLIELLKTRQTLSKVPSPPGHWLIGNMDILLSSTSDKFFLILRDFAAKYRPIYRISLPYITTINILHPEDFEIILSQTKHMRKSKLYQFLQNWLGEGLLTSYGSKWQVRRKILTRSFHFNILLQFLSVFQEGTETLISQIEELNGNSGPNFVNIVPLVTHMTLLAMSETSMGLKTINTEMVENYRNSIHKIGRLLLERIASPILRIPYLYKYTKNGREEDRTVKTLHDFTHRIIKEREKHILDNDRVEFTSTSYSGKKMIRMLDLLLLAKIEENTIDYEGIREEVDTFMFEGHDTTAVAISFLLHSLARYPEIQEEVRKEMQIVLENIQYPTYNDLQNLEYTERAIKESLRLYPSVPLISRVASEDFVSSTGYLLPKGTVLHMHIFDLHRDPTIYPDPLKFDPDRFLPENCSERHPFAYLPFSAGPRNCIGQKFAILEIKSVICGILRKYRLESDTETLNFIPDLVLRTDSEIRVKFTPIET